MKLPDVTTAICVTIAAVSTKTLTLPYLFSTRCIYWAAIGQTLTFACAERAFAWRARLGRRLINELLQSGRVVWLMHNVRIVEARLAPEQESIGGTSWMSIVLIISAL